MILLLSKGLFFVELVFLQDDVVVNVVPLVAQLVLHHVLIDLPVIGVPDLLVVLQTLKVDLNVEPIRLLEPTHRVVRELQELLALLNAQRVHQVEALLILLSAQVFETYVLLALPSAILSSLGQERLGQFLEVVFVHEVLLVWMFAGIVAPLLRICRTEVFVLLHFLFAVVGCHRRQINAPEVCKLELAKSLLVEFDSLGAVFAALILFFEEIGRMHIDSHILDCLYFLRHVSLLRQQVLLLQNAGSLNHVFEPADTHFLRQADFIEFPFLGRNGVSLHLGIQFNDLIFKLLHLVVREGNWRQGLLLGCSRSNSTIRRRLLLWRLHCFFLL